MSNPFDDDTMFEDPAPSGGGQFPSIAQLLGRLVVIEPQEYDPKVESNFNPGEFEARLVAHVTFLDGGEIDHRARENDDPVEFDSPILVGQTMENYWLNKPGIVNPCKNKIGKIVLGRIERGDRKPGRRPPYILVAASAEDRAVAKAWWDWKENGGRGNFVKGGAGAGRRSSSTAGRTASSRPSASRVTRDEGDDEPPF